MRTLGFVLLIFNVLCLIGGGVVMARIGKHRSDVSVGLSTSRTASEKAVKDHEQATLNLEAKESELARVKLGWDREWEQSANVNQGLGLAVQPNATIIANGLGTANGLRPHEVQENGVLRQIAPTIHVFSLGQNGEEQTSFYIGEFTVDLAQLQPNRAVLVPNWNVPNSELQRWVFNNGFRLRSLIPPAERARIDNLNRLIQETVQAIAVLQQRNANQAKAKASAEAELKVRNGELLGNSDHPVIDGRPEYTDGLLKAIKDLEDDRNVVQASVDNLRRLIKSLADARGLVLQEIVQLASRLPKAAAQVSQLPE